MVGTTARHGSGMQNVISYRFAFVAILRVLSSIILFSLLLILTNVDFTRAFYAYIRMVTADGGLVQVGAKQSHSCQFHSDQKKHP